ncbi:MAG: ComEC/Rec2 family competence protein [Capsulimonas sp.]|uniref:ComEC/Rec2 family competence protein n=1 Tax=Capsulimonas sp. TaxID=2494211 RepID=UPI003265DC15
MRASLQHRPLLCFSCAFALGVAARGAGYAPVWLIASLLALGVLLLLWRTSCWPAAAAGLLLAGLACGALRESAARVIPPNDISHHTAPGVLSTVTGFVANDPETRPGHLVFRLRAEQIQTRGETMAATGQIYVTLASAQGRALPTLDYGDHVALRGYLDRPQDATNPGAFSWRDYLARQGVYATLSVRQPPAEISQRADRNPFFTLAWTTRRKIVSSLNAHLPPTDAAVLCGILIGRRVDLDASIMSSFVHTGTVHILASAGLHVGILLWWLLAAARRLTLPRRWSALGIIAILWLYAVMAGGRPSVTRAVLLATVYLGALLFEREPDLSTALGFAALVILLDNPQTLFDAGFQMSFFTVATLAAAMPLWSDYWRGRSQQWTRLAPAGRRAVFWALELTGLTLFAQLGSAPIVASAYNEFSLSGVLANLLVVPALFLIIPLGFLTAVLAGVSHAAGAFGAMLLLPLLDYVIAVVRACGEGPWAFRAIQTPSVLSIALYYGGIAAATYFLSRSKISVDLAEIP